MSLAWGQVAGIVTLTLMLVFIGIWIWAWRPRHRPTFDTMAQLPLHDADAASPTAEGRPR